MEIQNFITEFKKTFIYDMLCESLEDEQLFEHVIVGNQVIWMKEQTRQMWSMWQAAKASVVPHKSCSVNSHEIIINETKSELIDSYDIAKEDEYLLESLVYRGVCIGKAQTSVPEGFVLVPREPTEKMIEAAESEAFDPYGEDFGKIYKAMIETQEPSNEQ